MPKVSTTRKELRKREERIELAQQGQEMLEQKRSALMKELLKVTDVVMTDVRELEKAANAAREALARAEVMAGSESLRSASLIARGRLELEINTVNLMGVRVPEIEQVDVRRSVLARGYSITGTSTSIDEAAAAFEVEVKAILRLAESELRLRRLAKEIHEVSRRVNSLEHIQIPRLKAERDYIEMALQERARDRRFRLKLVKQSLERGRGR